ncbi:MAG TPA: DUF4406 domain-containing protein [Synergistaceae bacterium]|nr:DUF4406 domain-containing protein [Synergistaceae bacterium]
MKEYKLPKETGERIRTEAAEVLEFCTGLPTNGGFAAQAVHEPQEIIRTEEQERSVDEFPEFCTALPANEGLSTQTAHEPQETIRAAEAGTREKETVYIAGKITGDPCYFSKFYAADQKLKAAGFIVLDPAMLPGEGFSHEAYMHMTTAMLDECDAVCFLPDWKESRGAIFEHARTAVLGKRIFYFDDWKEAMQG